MTDWLSIGNEDLTYRPRAKAGDKVYHATKGIVCTVETARDLLGRESIELMFGCRDGTANDLVGRRGRLLPEWEHVQ